MADPVAVPWWKYVRALGPVVLFWAALVGWLAYLLADRARVGPKTDEANLHEWIDEARSFRKTVPELVREYLARLDAYNGDATAAEVRVKAEEIAEQLKAMADPIRLYQGQLPSFPEIYILRVRFPNRPAEVEDIVWKSPAPMPRERNPSNVRQLDHAVGGPGGVVAVVHCEYRVHAFSKLQRDEAEQQDFLWLVAGVVLGGSLLALVWVWTFLRRERRRELREVENERDLEHAKLEKLEAVQAADAAERANLEMRSNLYASIGIMAGSYAHNIKNLLVRPNDLINRCLEADGMSRDQSHMLTEVKATLGTVTERLQMILRTVRRDPTRAEMTGLDLNALILETGDTWGTIGKEKWKLTVTATPAVGPLPIRGDLSHLQQAVENLVFNARDATFEMRNHVRDAARAEKDPAKRKQALIDAAAWRGEVTITGRRDENDIVLEVRDNGIGMTPEVRQRCLDTHFTTKRDNALYEGYNAGMGLGLSFVAVVLEHHGATLEVESEPLRGAMFRVRFPVA